MRRAMLAVVWLGLALGQSLKAPGEAALGAEVTVAGQDLPPGTYALEVTAPDGGERVYTVDASTGRFRFAFTPEETGPYRFRLRLDGGFLEAVLKAVLPPPRFTTEGLWLAPGRTLPLPDPGRWLGPVVEGRKVYVARGLLVLAIDRLGGEVRRLYPPEPVVRLLPGPELVLASGRRLGLSDLERQPFAAPWSRLKELGALEKALGPYAGARPYWSYLAAGVPEPDRLPGIAADLLRRGHRPELSWTSDAPFGPWLSAARRSRESGLRAAVAWTRFFFEALPGFPGVEAFLRDQADWLSAQGQEEEAARLRAGLPWIAHYHRRVLRPLLSGLLAFALLAYLALFLKGIFGWRPGQGRWPGAGLGLVERVLALLLLLLAGAGVLGLGALGPVEGAFSGPLSRATLDLPSVRAVFAGLPPGPERDLLLAGRFDPLALLRADPAQGAARQALGLGGDPWTPAFQRAGVDRPPLPSTRTLEMLLFTAQLRDLTRRPWTALGRFFPSPPLLVLGLLAFVGLFAYQVALLFVRPRPPGRLAWAFALLVPGLFAFDAGVGLLLFGLALFASWRMAAGETVWAAGLAAAYLLHWGYAFLGRRR